MIGALVQRFRWGRLLLQAALLLLLGGVPTAWAQGRPPPDRRPVPTKPQPPPPTQEVEVEILVVHATNDHQKVDPRLRSLLPHLRHLNYTGFDVLDVRRDDLSERDETSFGIAGGRRMQVELLDVDPSRARMRVRMYDGQRRLLDTTVSIHRNRSFIVAGPKHQGGVLILPMTARY